MTDSRPEIKIESSGAWIVLVLTWPDKDVTEVPMADVEADEIENQIRVARYQAKLWREREAGA